MGLADQRTRKLETESTIEAAQDQVLTTNWKVNLADNKMSLLCHRVNKTIAHITNECHRLALNHYKLW